MGSRRLLWLLGALAATALVTPAAFPAAPATVRFGALEVPADCALARNERPRLLFRARDLPAYKARIAGPLKADFERFKAYWDRRISDPAYRWTDIEIPDGICLGVLYQLTGDRRYADVVRRQDLFKSGSRFWAHPFTLDLIANTLTPEEVTAQADRFLKDGEQTYRYQQAWALWPALALYGAGSGRDEEIARWLPAAVRGAEQQMAEANVWAETRGGDVNSFSYIGNHTVIALPAVVTALANALGRDAWDECLWARHLASYYVYHYLPWRRAAIHFDNTHGVPTGPNPKGSGDFGGSYLLAAAPARYQDGLYQWWANLLLESEGDSPTAMAGLWGRILFYDPAVPPLGPESFPPSRFFLTRGMASMRENWKPDATFVHFRCGAFGGLGDNRHNADNNTFTVYRKGILALDTGGAHAMDAHALKFQPAEDYHSVQYAAETIAHNGVLVYHPDDDAFWKEYGKANTGGQILRRWPAEWDRLRGFAESPFEIARRGKVVAWETSPDYDYVCGDATGSHSPTTVASFTRQLVYVRPDLVLVYDRIETARDGCRTTWLLHTADRPAVDGKETPDPRVHPEGHFLWEGQTVSVTDGQIGGRLFCRMLLPEEREVRLLGGENHEFELPGGRNIGPTPETYALAPDTQAIREARAAGVGLRGWRVEVEDRGGGRSVRFLNVLQTADRDRGKMVACEPVTQDGFAGAKLTLDDGTVEVLFKSEGEPGGKITVVRKGKTVVSRSLAVRIEDDYGRWKDHPDHPKWTTDPFRRSVVLGKGR